MSLSWPKIKEDWIKDFRIGYSRRSIEAAFNTIIDFWGREFLNIYKNRSSWGVTTLVDLGLLLHELHDIEGSEDLISRLKTGEAGAFSEARIATFFSKAGLDIHLQPIVDGLSGPNDIAVKVGDEWIIIEVKTPQKSELQKELEQDMNELLDVANKISSYRDVCIYLSRVPTKDEQEIISNLTLDLATRDTQPLFGQIANIAVIKTDVLCVKATKVAHGKGERWLIEGPSLSTSYPELMRAHYEDTPVLFVSHMGGRRMDNPNIHVMVIAPFDDDRIINIIEKKRRQLSSDSMNMVALDTTHIPNEPDTKSRYRWTRRILASLKTKLSRRIGAVLLFEGMIYEGRVVLKSSLFEHPNPYKKIPPEFLEKCILDNYADLRQEIFPSYL